MAMKRVWLAAALACTGCGGGVTPELYNFVVDYFTAPASCYRDMMPGSTQVTTGRLSGGQFTVWDGPDGKAFLSLEGAAASIDMGDAPSVSAGSVLEGSAGSAGWAFTSELVTRQSQGGATPTVTTRGKVTFTFARGVTFKGTLAASSSTSCEGTGCPANFATDNPTCNIDGVVIRGSRVAVDYEKAP